MTMAVVESKKQTIYFVGHRWFPVIRNWGAVVESVRGERTDP